MEVVEGTPGGAEEAMKMIPVEEEEDHITMEKISKMNAVIIQLVMATWSLHYCKILQLLLYSLIFFVSNWVLLSYFKSCNQFLTENSPSVILGYDLNEIARYRRTTFPISHHTLRYISVLWVEVLKRSFTALEFSTSSKVSKHLRANASTLAPPPTPPTMFDRFTRNFS